MNATALRDLNINPLLLPPTDMPYILQDVFELVEDGCRIELVFQWNQGHSLFRANEDTDTISHEFYIDSFLPRKNHSSYRSIEQLTDEEMEVLKSLERGPKTKQDLDQYSRILGSVRDYHGMKSPGMIGKGLIEGQIQGKENLYTILEPGKFALSARNSPLTKNLKKECGWTWVAINQQGYWDTVLLSFNGMVPGLILHVMASSIEVFLAIKNP